MHERLVERAMSASTTSLQPDVVGQRLQTAMASRAGASGARALEHCAHDQALERDADGEQVEDFFAGQHRDVRAAVALAHEQALVAEGLDGRAHRRAGDAELRRELGLGQRRARARSRRRGCLSRSEATTASVVEIGVTASPLIRRPSA